MTKPNTKPDDPEQSKRFHDMACESEAAGELDPAGAEEAFDRLMKKVAPPKKSPN